MGQPIVKYRLSDEPSQFSLSCTDQGLTLAGVPLLRRGEVGFQPRPPWEIGRLLARAYQTGIDLDGVTAGLGAVARALNDGEMARAMITAVLLKLPELDWDGAARIAHTDDALAKAGYDDLETRDPDGRWAGNGGSDASFAGYSHHYLYRTLVCSRPTQHCSVDDAWDGLLRNAYPGQDPMNGPIPDGGGDYKVFAEQNGPIRSTPDEKNKIVTNKALVGHMFFPGTVTRSVIELPEGIYIQTEGHGYNSSIANWVENHAAGYLGFQGPDANIRAYIRNPGFYDRTKR